MKQRLDKTHITDINDTTEYFYRSYGISMLNIYKLKFAFYRFSFNCRLYTLKKGTKIRADLKKLKGPDEN